MLNQIFSEIIFGPVYFWILMEALAIFLDPEYAPALGLVRRQPELCDAVIWKKKKTAKQTKKNQSNREQINKALSTHAMVAQGEGCPRRFQLFRRGGGNPEWSLDALSKGVLANRSSSRKYYK